MLQAIILILNFNFPSVSSSDASHLEPRAPVTARSGTKYVHMHRFPSNDVTASSSTHMSTSSDDPSAASDEEIREKRRQEHIDHIRESLMNIQGNYFLTQRRLPSIPTRKLSNIAENFTQRGFHDEIPFEVRHQQLEDEVAAQVVNFSLIKHRFRDEKWPSRMFYEKGHPRKKEVEDENGCGMVLREVPRPDRQLSDESIQSHSSESAIPPSPASLPDELTGVDLGSSRSSSKESSCRPISLPPGRLIRRRDMPKHAREPLIPLRESKQMSGLQSECAGNRC